jgi:DNA (cytosine-5)-methyltransferase 1
MNRHLTGTGPPTVVELFAGAGCLAVGLAKAGFAHLALVENDPKACQTLRKNAGFRTWTTDAVVEADARMVDLAKWSGKAWLLAAGVPCQPFSHGGRGDGHSDERDLFPVLLDAVRALRPKVVLVENVFGLLRPSFRPYFAYILDQLRLPDVERRGGERWEDHAARLERELTRTLPRYLVGSASLQAADFGTAQRRLRVFIQAISVELEVEPPWPTTTHSESALVAYQDSGAYWRSHGLRRGGKSGKFDYFGGNLSPWRTVRDAVTGLGTPVRSRAAHVPNHDLIPGARSYSGHTGSRIDWPAKTLKAGVHGVAGGEGTVILGNGRLRYLTVREAARLQDLDDDYWLPDVRTVAWRQLGNAVPVRVAEAVGRQLFSRASAHRAVTNAI